MMKKFVLIFVSVIFLSAFSFGTAYAEESIEESLIQSIEQLETEEGFDTSYELNKYLVELNTQLSSSNDFEEIETISLLINELKELITINNSYNEGVRTRVVDPTIPYQVAVGTVISYFKSKGYHLAAELLLHAKQNKVIDSRYTPTAANTVQVKQTAVFKTLMNGSTMSGSQTFSPSNSNYDLHYSINKFDYTFNGYGIYRTMYVSDRYDYEWDTSYPTIPNVAVNAMVVAQMLGIIKPFQVYFTVTR